MDSARFDHMFVADSTADLDAVELAERCRKAAGTDVSFASDDELCAAAVDLERALGALGAAQLHVLAELDDREVCDRSVGLSTASWLAEHTHLPRGVASGRVRVATKLRRRFDQVDQALSEGRISFDHARTIVDAANPRIVDQVTDHQTQIIDHAQHAPFAIWRRALGERCELWDQDGGYDPTRDRSRNQLHLNGVGDTTAISGELVGELALTVTQILDHEADRLWRRYHQDHELAPELDIPSRATLRAEALAEVCRRSQGTEPGHAPTTDITLVAHLHEPDPFQPPKPPEPDEPDDIDDTLAEATINQPTTAEPTTAQPTTAAPPEPTIAAPTTAAPAPTTAEPTEAAPTSGDLRRDLRSLGLRPTTLRTPDGARLDPDRYAHLLCDPIWHPLLVDHQQIPLALGHAVRLATPGQRRALAIRDRGCVFPGCDRPPGWCDAHHIIPWDQHGTTDLEWLALLCRRHHGVTHRRDWTMTPDPGGGYHWTTPTGLVLFSQPRHPTRPAHPDASPAAR